MNQTDINDLIKVREAYSKNSILGYLNINSLRNQIINLRDAVAKVPIDILCVDETKLDESFPDSQFLIENYQFPPFRRDRNSKGGGKIVYVREGLISKRLKQFESEFIETSALKLKSLKRNVVYYSSTDLQILINSLSLNNSLIPETLWEITLKTF